MKKILTVIKREYLQIVRSKGFIIGTVLGPILMIALIVIPVVLAVATSGDKKQIAVVDGTGQVYGELDAKLAEYKMKDGSRRYTLERILPAADWTAQKKDLGARVLAKGFGGYIYIPADILSGGTAEWASMNTSDFDELKRFNEALNAVVIEKRLKNEGLDPQKIAGYIQRVRLNAIKVTAQGQEQDTGGTFIVAYILAFLIYMTMFFYGSIILRGVIEEKSSRVVEVVLSSMTPFQLMMGKILGIGLVGLTQYSIWALFGFIVTRYGGSIVGAIAPAAVTSGFHMAGVPAYVFVYFVIFFLLGYFLYASLYAAVGSMVNNEKEAQQMLFPITMVLIVPILMLQFIMKNPNGATSVILSLIPFFAPILMQLRVSTLFPPAGQLAASLGLLVLTIVGMVWLTAKIYRVGILMYGKKPSLPEILKWVRYK
jgi:ABC-2 type transport system permease protein